MWNNPETLWLNVTNFALAGVCVVAWLALSATIGYELLVRRRRAAVAVADDHTFMVPGLGLTMADGGEPHKNDPKA